MRKPTSTGASTPQDPGNAPAKKGPKKSMQSLAKLGGMARKKTLSPERRSEIAKKAAQARWEKKEE